MIFIRRVVGDSMEPTLHEGQVIICHNLRDFRKGQVVVAYMNGRVVVKRITKITNGQIHLEGDNKSHSTDSRTHGRISVDNIEGVVIWPRKL